jgi:hypothetical protein
LGRAREGGDQLLSERQKGKGWGGSLKERQAGFYRKKLIAKGSVLLIRPY